VKGKLAKSSGYPVLFTLPRNMVYPALLPLMRTPRLPVVDRTDAPAYFKRTGPFRRKTKPGFCACAITFQTQSTLRYELEKREKKTFSRRKTITLRNFLCTNVCARIRRRLENPREVADTSQTLHHTAFRNVRIPEYTRTVQ
jgi:hypothetical protein